MPPAKQDYTDSRKEATEKLKMHRTISESEFFANNKVKIISVADPDVYPRSQILIFIYPGSRIQQQQEKGGGGFVVLPFL
jgi:hypothetical protein